MAAAEVSKNTLPVVDEELVWLAVIALNTKT